MSYNTKLVKDGNSMAVRLPKALLAVSGLDGNVQLEAKKGRIIIKQLQRPPRQHWAEQIHQVETEAPQQPDDTFGDMEAVAEDGLSDIPWQGPSYDEGYSAMPKGSRFTVYWFDPNPTQGAELRKIRPCVVLSPQEMNDALRTVIVAPLTTTLRPWPFRLTVTVMGTPASVACDQMRAIDASRLKHRITTLNPTDSRAILQICREIFS